MLLELTSDQEFLRDTTAKFLDNESPVAELRRLRNSPEGYEPNFWKRGADLGWVSLLVSEQNGGGSVSGQGPVDLTLIAHEFGRHAAPGPLAATNVVAAALDRAGSAVHAPVLAGLLAGTSVATWCLEEGPATPVGRIGLRVDRDGDDLVLSGTKGPVEAAAQADWFLVAAQAADGPVQVLVPRDCEGLTVTPLQTVDLTRRFATVGFESVRVPAANLVEGPAGGDALLQELLDLGLLILSAETVGAMERSFDMTVEWAFDRYSFGRPLASYQELKHRFADMKSWLEAAHGLVDATAQAVAARDPGASELAAAAKAFTGQYGGEMLQDCVQIHGGIGLTFDHDLHLFLRRVTVNRMTYGTPARQRQRVADYVIAREIASK